MKINRIEIDGIDALDKQLAALGTEVATKIGEKAVKAGANVLKGNLVEAAPVATGKISPAHERYGSLRQNIRVGVVKSFKVNWIGYSVNAGRAFWARFYEFGTEHQPARPFWRPTVSASKEEITATEIAAFNAGIDAALAKNGGR